MKSIYTIKSGRGNAMFCLYHTFDECRSYGVVELTHHIANLSTNYEKAVAKAKALYKEYKGQYSQLVIGEEWELREIKRLGTTESKVIPAVEEITKPQIEYPSSKKVGTIGHIEELTLGVTDSFTFDGRFGRGLCTKFVDANHNVFVSFSKAKFVYSLTVGDTIHCTAEIKDHNFDVDCYGNEIIETNITKIKEQI